MVNKLKKYFVKNGLTFIIYPLPCGKSKRPIKFGGDVQDKIVQLANQKTPESRRALTLKEKVATLVKQGIVGSISEMTVTGN